MWTTDYARTYSVSKNLSARGTINGPENKKSGCGYPGTLIPTNIYDSTVESYWFTSFD